MALFMHGCEAATFVKQTINNNNTELENIKSRHEYHNNTEIKINCQKGFNPVLCYVMFIDSFLF